MGGLLDRDFRESEGFKDSVGPSEEQGEETSGNNGEEPENELSEVIADTWGDCLDFVV